MENGFTLTEILITIVIFLLIGIVVLNVYLLSQKVYKRGENQAELLQNGRVISERITRELRQAKEVVTALPQVADNPDNPPFSEIEFQDGHTTSTDYYYIRYYIPEGTKEIYRQYRAYCFDPCESCIDYFRWDDTKIEGEETIYIHACNLEERIIGEHLSDLKIWGSNLINISFTLEKDNEEIKLETNVFGRNF